MLNETVRHYDLQVEFFQQFLDPYMKYTSGLFESTSDDLHSACQRMLDKIISLGAILPGCRVLEVGPGWGALLRRIQERNIICEYVGVSPSRTQNNYIRTFSKQNEHLVTSTFEQFYSGKKYDVIVLIGSFCHLKEKPQQLKKMVDLLAPGGKIIIEDTFFSSRLACRKYKANSATRFLQNDVFGFAEIHSMPEQLEQFAAAGLKVNFMLEHSQSYHETIAQWLARLRLLDVNDFPQAREFMKYLHIAQRGWNYTTQNQLMVLSPLKGIP